MITEINRDKNMRNKRIREREKTREGEGVRQVNDKLREWSGGVDIPAALRRL